MRPALPALLLALGVAGVPSAAEPTFLTDEPAKAEPFGQLPDGTKISRYTLTNKNGMTVKVMTYGAIVTDIVVPDKDGKKADVALGFDDLAGYLKGHPFFGANAGRCANRIAKGKFKLGDKEYTLATNNGPNHLHGGKEGFDKKVWKGHATGPNALQFTYSSPDGEEGYPGKLDATITYTLTDANELVVGYHATTDQPTVCNLAHHSYFNLAGHDGGDVTGQVVEIMAKNYTPADDTLVPTGKIEPVAGTPFDFTRPKAIGKELKQAGKDPAGYDLNYVLDKGSTAKPELAARVTDPKSGRVMEVLTTEPGVQFYTGNFLDGSNVGKGGAKYAQYNGFCLEAQKFPDSVNKPEWKDKSDAVLRPGQKYSQTTVYKFGVAK